MRYYYEGQRPKARARAEARDSVTGVGYRRAQRSRQSKSRR